MRHIAASSLVLPSFLLVACKWTPASHYHAAAPVLSAASTGSSSTMLASGSPPAASAPSAAQTPTQAHHDFHSLEEQEADLRATSERVRPQLPKADQPSDEERASLRDCDAEALYYGIGKPPDYVQARQCAYTQLPRTDRWSATRSPGEFSPAPIFGGASILLMLYVNGKGVPRNLDLATRFACDIGGALAELGGTLGAIEHIRAGSSSKSELDLCDHATSGFMAGACAAHQERIATVPRQARKARATAGLPRPELDALQRAAQGFFAARTRNEVDLTGTMRAALMIEEQAKLEGAYVQALEQVKSATVPPSSGDTDGTESDLNRIYSQLMTCPEMAATEKLGATTVTRKSIRVAQRAWLSYRQAWITLGRKVRPETQRDAWRAWITRDRIRMLADLAVGCATP